MEDQNSKEEETFLHDIRLFLPGKQKFNIFILNNHLVAKNNAKNN